MSKAEKRIAKRTVEEEKRKSRQAIEVEKILAKKRPEQSVSPTVKKEIPPFRSGESRYPHLMRYRKDREDREGSWTWGIQRNWHPNPGDGVIYGHLDDFASKTWGEIHRECVKHSHELKHKFYGLTQIHREAYDRLIELHFDDQDQIFRFRLSGKQRLYGFVINIDFYTVWFDPKHQIYHT